MSQLLNLFNNFSLLMKSWATSLSPRDSRIKAYDTDYVTEPLNQRNRKEKDELGSIVIIMLCFE